MQLLLAKIRSLRGTNGDVFFVGVARVFFATSHVPWNHQLVYQKEGSDLELPKNIKIC